MISRALGKLIPDLCPKVEEDLLKCLATEVEIYSNNVVGKKCLLCPFRVLSRASYLRRHLAYHSETNMYVADRRSPQLTVIRAIFDRRRAIFPLSNDVCDTLDLLKHSAVLIANWNINCTLVTWKLLQSTNRPILVRVLTHHGPEY